jgi:hypothetical protein
MEHEYPYDDDDCDSVADTDSGVCPYCGFPEGEEFGLCHCDEEDGDCLAGYHDDSDDDPDWDDWDDLDPGPEGAGPACPLCGRPEGVGPGTCYCDKSEEDVRAEEGPPV